MARIHYSNCFMHKRNSCSWQPEHHIISRYEGLQYSFKISKRLIYSGMSMLLNLHESEDFYNLNINPQSIVVSVTIKAHKKVWCLSHFS